MLDKARKPAGATTMSSREFNQNTSAAKRAARNGPVFVTERGRPSHVLLSVEDYERLNAKTPAAEAPGKVVSLREALMDPNPEADFDFEFPELKDAAFTKPVDFG
jgi:prevent-host-death family protein